MRTNSHRNSILSAIFTLMTGPLLCTQVMATGINIDVNNDAFYADIIAGSGVQDFNVSASLFHHQDHGSIFSIGGHVHSAVREMRNITGTLGAKAYYVDEDSGLDGTLIGLGGSINVVVSAQNKIHVEGLLYFVPEVLSFQDFEGGREASLKLKLQLLENGSIYVGYRNFRLDVENRKHAEFEKGAMVGLDLNF